MVQVFNVFLPFGWGAYFIASFKTEVQANEFLKKNPSKPYFIKKELKEVL